jgi:hypothetical protein
MLPEQPATSRSISHSLPGSDPYTEWVPATHTLTGYLNGVAIPNVSIVDSTFSTGLAFGFAFDAENNNGSTVQSFAGDGGTSSGGGGGPMTYVIPKKSCVKQAGN